MKSTPTCRFCNAALLTTFVDLGVSPLANSYVSEERLDQMEPFYPLHVYVCDGCRLVQLLSYESPEAIFTDYAYFSSYSETWIEHGRLYAEAMIERWNLGAKSLVMEVASNDGYLLQHFKARQIPVLGIEPAVNVAKVAIEKGIPTRTVFFGQDTARSLAYEGQQADLLAGNNVYAHVPDVHAFTAGLKVVLKARGVITLEFPHLLQLLKLKQFDTIYHEHFSYYSLLVVESIFARHGLAVFDVEELPTHGGSLRIFGKHAEDSSKAETAGLQAVRNAEAAACLDSSAGYADFARSVAEIKCDLLEFLIEARRSGKTVAGYGAPAKGNTLLNYCGVGPELLPYTVDRSPHKQGQYLPGSRIPVRAPARILELRPDYVLILPWNIKEEIMQQMEQVREWGGRFVTPIPKVSVL